MTKTASAPLPKFKLPKLDLDTLFGLHKANLAAVHEAQTVLVDAAQAIVRLQHGWTEEVVAGSRAVLSRKAPQQPGEALAGAKAAAEKAGNVAKQAVDVAAAAQRRVADLFAQRAAANVNELKALAA